MFVVIIICKFRGEISYSYKSKKHKVVKTNLAQAVYCDPAVCLQEQRIRVGI